MSVPAQNYAVGQRAPLRKPLDPHLVRDIVRAADVAIVLLSGLVAYALIEWDRRGYDWRYLNAICITGMAAGVVFHFQRIYRNEAVFARIPKLSPILGGWLAVIGLVLTIAFGLKVSDYFSRLWAAAWILTGTFMLIGSRVALGFVVDRLTRSGMLAQRVAIYGTGQVARRLAAHLRARSELPIQIVGFIDDGSGDAPAAVEGFPVIGTSDDLVRLARDEHVEQVLVALPGSDEARIRTIVDRLSVLPISVKLVPDLVAFDFLSHKTSTLSGVALLHIFDRPISGWSQFLKAAEDRIGAALMLLLVAPIMVMIALAIKLDSPGPVFFKQPRVGFNSRLFNVLKFRTMHHAMRDEHCAIQTTRGDPRVTRVGRFLRRTSLDELPQLINILRGEMSIVGPRPHALSTKAEGQLFEEVVDKYAARHRVKPGLTGWAQVKGWRGETDTIEKIRKRVEHDLYYIENWSIMFDVVIIVRTVLLVFRDQKAY